ncbi:MAG: aldehyde ferredoxin oxidoreductase N-terminal domain-containing protein [Syntrophales bacterium]|jgi:aldehyde:ferredoxin oxidoreductase
MNSFQPFYNRKIGVVDLSASKAEVIPLVQKQVSRHIGGAAMNSAILEGYQDDALVFGTGPLTGSFAPASSLMIASFASLVFNSICHVPFMLRTGPDMKFSGIDYLVVKGTAPERSILHVNHGKIRTLPAGNLQHMHIPEAIRELKKASPLFQSVIITGPAADRGIPFASVSIGTNGSLDKAGLASLMAAKNLKGIMLGGTEGLPFNRDNPQQGKELEKIISTDKNFKHRGFYSVLKKLEGGEEAGKFLKASGEKDMACYHCPSPCMTHVRYSWHDPRKKEMQNSKEGLLLLDHTGYAALAEKVGKNILPVLRACLHYGLDPAAVAEKLSEGGTMLEYLNAIDKIISDNPPQTTDVSQRQCLFGGGLPPILTGDVLEKKVAIAMILGVCPIFLLRFAQITDATLLSFISTSEEDLTTLQEGLSSAISSL